MITKQVTVSGTVGKQVYATSDDSIRLLGLSTYSPSGKCNVAIRSGNASGSVVLEVAAPSGESLCFEFPNNIKFDKGMHVKVLGTNAKAYLFVE